MQVPWSVLTPGAVSTVLQDASDLLLPEYSKAYFFLPCLSIIKNSTLKILLISESILTLLVNIVDLGKVIHVS